MDGETFLFDYEKWERKRYGFACILAAVAYPLWGVMVKPLVPHVYDPMVNRLVVATLLVIAAIGIFKTKHYKQVFWFGMYLFLWSLMWVTRNSGDHIVHLSGTVMAFMGTGFFLQSIKELVSWYLAALIPFIYFEVLNPHPTREIPLSILLMVYSIAIMVVMIGTWDRVRLIERLRDLNVKNRDLVDNVAEKNRELAISAMAVTLGHEINNPLTIAFGIASTIKQHGYDESRMERLRDALRKISEIVRKIQEIKAKKVKFSNYAHGVEMIDIHGKDEEK